MKKKTHAKPISLAPLTFDQALRGLLAVPVPVAKAKGGRPSKKKAKTARKKRTQ